MHRYEILKKIESNVRTYGATYERVFEQGKGVWIKDSAGREIFDCLSCAGALSLGHNHPEINEALVEFLGSGQLYQALDMTTPAKFDFVQQLYETLPSDFAKKSRILFCGPSGSDAVEAAMKLVRYATQKQSIIAFHGAYHGMTGSALAAMGNLGPKSGGGINTGIHFAPYPYQFRCPFGTNGKDTDALSLKYLETILTDPESGITKPAAVVLEVVQGEGGCIPASTFWLREIRRMTESLNICLIIDEVQTGIGRTGDMYAFQRAGIEPDVLILSKAVGGGFPLAVILFNENLDKWPRGMHAGTFRGNQIAMVAGRKAIEIIQRDRLYENAAHMGEKLYGGLKKLSEQYSIIGDVRGRGLMLGVEIVEPGNKNFKGVQDGKMAKKIKLAAIENGLLIETGGRHGAVLRLLPPLIITSSDVDIILEKLDSSIKLALNFNVFP